MGEKKKSGCLPVFIVFILIIAAAIFVINEFGGISLTDPLVRMVQLSSPQGETVRLEKALGDFFADESWESFVATDGNTYVNFQGKAFYGDNIEVYVLQFLVGEEKGVSFWELSAIEVADDPKNAAIFGNELLDKVYEEFN